MKKFYILLLLSAFSSKQLIHASDLGNYEVEEMVIDSEETKPSVNALVEAIKKSNTDIDRLISPDNIGALATLASGNASEQYTPLHYAIKNDNESAVNKLLEKAKEYGKDIVNIKGADGVTPLYVAVSLGNINIVATLLRAGADPTIQDSDGNTSLDLAKEVWGEDSRMYQILNSEYRQNLSKMFE